MSERTLSVTVGPWGGIYAHGTRDVPCWRLCLGFVAITYFRGEWTEAITAWLDARAVSR